MRMPSCRTIVSVAILCLLAGSSRMLAQGEAAAGSTELNERLERMEKLLRRLEQRERESLGLRSSAEAPGQHPYLPPTAMAAWPGHWHHWQPWYPWFSTPQTAAPENAYGDSIEHTPRLGLQAIYRDAQHLGIRPPADRDAILVVPNLGSFEGVVGAAKAQLRAEAKAAEAGGKGVAVEAPVAADDEAVKLLKAGKYKEAGRLAAARLQESQTVADALILVEAFFALGKYATAETLLLTALEAENAVDALPEELASHFGAAEEFEKKLQELDSQGGFRLLHAYFKVHSREPEKGLEALQEMPQLAAAKILWKRYLGKAFK